MASSAIMAILLLLAVCVTLCDALAQPALNVTSDGQDGLGTDSCVSATCGLRSALNSITNQLKGIIYEYNGMQNTRDELVTFSLLQVLSLQLELFQLDTTPEVVDPPPPTCNCNDTLLAILAAIAHVHRSVNVTTQVLGESLAESEHNTRLAMRELENSLNRTHDEVGRLRSDVASSQHAVSNLSLLVNSTNEAVMKLDNKTDQVSRDVNTLSTQLAAHTVAIATSVTAAKDETIGEVGSVSANTIQSLSTLINHSTQTIQSLVQQVTLLNSSLVELKEQLRFHDTRSGGGGGGTPGTGTPNNNLQSCSQIKALYPALPSDYYTITTPPTSSRGATHLPSNDDQAQTHTVYCEMDELCGSTDGWTRLAYNDLDRPDSVCPPEYRLYEQDGVRACMRPVTTRGSCPSTMFSSLGVQYSQLCGRVIGYQYYTPNGIEPTHRVTASIDSFYVDGVVLTHGSPRTHIWTFMAGYYETNVQCPCADPLYTAPTFVGNDYFCETGSKESPIQPRLHTEDPLWDGLNCNQDEVGCCEPPFNPPWFHKLLLSPTTDDIEMRICCSAGNYNEDVGVSMYEIYVR